MASWLVRAIPERASGFEPWLGAMCCVLWQDTLLSCTVPLSTQVYKLVPNAGGNHGNPALDYHPIQGDGEGGRNTPSRFMLQKAGLALVMQTLPLCLTLP